MTQNDNHACWVGGSCICLSVWLQQLQQGCWMWIWISATAAEIYHWCSFIFIDQSSLPVLSRLNKQRAKNWLFKTIPSTVRQQGSSSSYLSWMEHQQNNIPKPTANHIDLLSSWNGHFCWIFIRHFINCSRFLQLETVVHDSSLVSPIFAGLHTAIYSYSHSYFHGLSSNCSVSFSVV